MPKYCDILNKYSPKNTVCICKSLLARGRNVLHTIVKNSTKYTIYVNVLQYKMIIRQCYMNVYNIIERNESLYCMYNTLNEEYMHYVDEMINMINENMEIVVWKKNDSKDETTTDSWSNTTKLLLLRLLSNVLQGFNVICCKLMLVTTIYFSHVLCKMFDSSSTWYCLFGSKLRPIRFILSKHLGLCKQSPRPMKKRDRKKVKVHDRPDVLDSPPQLTRIISKKAEKMDLYPNFLIKSIKDKCRKMVRTHIYVSETLLKSFNNKKHPELLFQKTTRAKCIMIMTCKCVRLYPLTPSHNGH